MIITIISDHCDGAESYLGLFLRFNVSRQRLCWFSLLWDWCSRVTCLEYDFSSVFWLAVSARFCFFVYFAPRPSLEHLADALELLRFNVVLWTISTSSLDFFACFNGTDCWRVTPWPAWKILTEEIAESLDATRSYENAIRRLIHINTLTATSLARIYWMSFRRGPSSKNGWRFYLLN